jgi:hypothetical protein
MNKTISAYLFPAGDESWGTSRVRVYKLNQYLQDYSINSTVINAEKKGNPFQNRLLNYIYYKTNIKMRSNFIHKNVNDMLTNNSYSKNDDNIFMFQKTIWDLETSILIELVKTNDGKVIFDLVDSYNERFFSSLIKNSNIVTTASLPMKEYLYDMYKDIKVEMIDLYIDYLNFPLPKRNHEKKDDIKIVFFAGPGNLRDISMCLDALLKVQEKYGLNFTYISGKNNDPLFKKLNVTHHKWDLNNYSNDLQQFDIAIAPQSNNLKPRSKLIEAISHNLPVIGSNVHSYRDLANKTNTLEYICESQDEWYTAIVNMLDPNNRNEYLEKTQDWVWKYHGKEYLTQKWIKLFNKF